MKKIMERVMDLAIMHSVISSHEGRMNVYHRYESLIEFEFKGRLMVHVEQYKRTYEAQRSLNLKKQIGEINRRIIEARMIWEQYAPRDS